MPGSHGRPATRAAYALAATGQPAADRRAARRPADHPAALLAPALPLLAGVIPGWSKSQADLLPTVAVVPRCQDRRLRRADPQPARRAGGQRPHVLAGHPDHRRDAAVRPLARLAAVVRGPCRRRGHRRREDDGAHRHGHPDRTRQAAPAARGGCHRRRPAARRPHRGGVPRRHHLVWLSGDDAGRRGPRWGAAAERVGRSTRGRGRSTRPCSRPLSTPAARYSRCGCATSTGTAASRPSRPISATTRCWARSAG